MEGTDKELRLKKDRRLETLFAGRVPDSFHTFGTKAWRHPSLRTGTGATPKAWRIQYLPVPGIYNTSCSHRLKNLNFLDPHWSNNTSGTESPTAWGLHESCEQGTRPAAAPSYLPLPLAPLEQYGLQQLPKTSTSRASSSLPTIPLSW